jgi:hypothetical protein
MNYFEPVPAQPSTPFDHFGWPTEVDPSAPAAGSALGLGLHASEFFYAPLPFDRDLVESMQTLSSLSEMQDATLPGTHMHRYPLLSIASTLTFSLRICMDEANASRGFWSGPTTNEQCV